MKYRKIFKNLLNYFRLNYYYCNFEEVVTLIGKNGVNFEISIESNHLSLVVEINGIRENYSSSKLFTKKEKEEVESIINSIYDVETKLKLLSVFFDNYRNKKSFISEFV